MKDSGYFDKKYGSTGNTTKGASLRKGAYNYEKKI